MGGLWFILRERGSDEAARGLEQGIGFPLPISLAQSPRGFAALVHLLARSDRKKTLTTQAKGRILFVAIVIKLFVCI